MPHLEEHMLHVVSTTFSFIVLSFQVISKPPVTSITAPVM